MAPSMLAVKLPRPVRQGRFKTKYDGYNRRVMTWVCKACKAWHQKKKPTECIECGAVDFIYFASRAEAKRFAELLLLLKMGQIRNLETQVRFKLIVNGIPIFKRGYYADFVYMKNDIQIVEDVKSTAKSEHGQTEIFNAKVNLMGAIHGIQVQIIKRS